MPNIYDSRGDEGKDQKVISKIAEGAEISIAPKSLNRMHPYQNFAFSESLGFTCAYWKKITSFVVYSLISVANLLLRSSLSTRT